MCWPRLAFVPWGSAPSPDLDRGESFSDFWTPHRHSTTPLGGLIVSPKPALAPLKFVIAFVVVAAVAAAVIVVPALLASEPVSPNVLVVETRPNRAGYDRSCQRKRQCVFGPAWSDDVTVPGGRNGCDTRNDVLRRDLTRIVIKPGTRGCVVLSGVLTDPYTGQQVVFERGKNTQVHIDHVFPLAGAWDLGAADWSDDTRRNFANDPVNLLATNRTGNLSKGDKTPGEWMPTYDRCGYARRYLQIADDYQLAITRADNRALSSALASCPG